MVRGRPRLTVVTDDKSSVHLGEALKARRIAAGLTQEGAAARAGITRNALAALEKALLVRNAADVNRVVVDAVTKPTPSPLHSFSTTRINSPQFSADLLTPEVRRETRRTSGAGH